MQIHLQLKLVWTGQKQYPSFRLHSFQSFGAQTNSFLSCEDVVKSSHFLDCPEFGGAFRFIFFPFFFLVVSFYLPNQPIDLWHLDETP